MKVKINPNLGGRIYKKGGDQPLAGGRVIDASKTDGNQRPECN